MHVFQGSQGQLRGGDLVRLLGKMRAYNAKILYLVSALPLGRGDPGQAQAVRRQIGEIEEARREVVAGVRSLAKRR